MSIAPKLLVNRLTPTARHMLESAIGRAANSRHAEVTVEHVLWQMAEPDDADVAAVYRHFGLDRRPIHVRLETILQQMKLSGGSRPVFTVGFWKWVQDAWTYGSLQFGAGWIRTGHLFYTLLVNPGRYIAGGSIPELEDTFTVEELDLELASALSVTREEIEAAAPAPAKTLTNPIERLLAATALRRGADVDLLLRELRQRAIVGSAASEWVELLAAALDREQDTSHPEAVVRATRAADHAMAALRSPSSVPKPSLRVVRTPHDD